MIALDTPTMVLQAALASATGTTEPVAHVVARTVPQSTKSSFEEYQSRLTRTLFTGAANVTICAAPQVNEFKAIEYVGVVNRSTDTETVTVSTYDGTNRYPLIVQGLAANQGLYYEENRGWYLVS
jgi:hypothetical protein